MTDSLRDQIAAVLLQRFHHKDDVPGFVFGESGAVADAVIAALNLPPNWGVPSFDNGDPTDSEYAE